MATDFQDIFIGALKNICNASVFFIPENKLDYIDLKDLEKVDPTFKNTINKTILVDSKEFVIVKTFYSLSCNLYLLNLRLQ